MHSRYRCDKSPDCTDGSDEAGCNTTGTSSCKLLEKMTTVLRLGHAWALQVLAYPGLRRAKSVQALIQSSPVEGMPKAVAERFVTGSYRL